MADPKGYVDVVKEWGELVAPVSAALLLAAVLHDLIFVYSINPALWQFLSLTDHLISYIQVVPLLSVIIIALFITTYIYTRTCIEILELTRTLRHLSITEHTGRWGDSKIAVYSKMLIGAVVFGVTVWLALAAITALGRMQLGWPLMFIIMAGSAFIGTWGYFLVGRQRQGVFRSEMLACTAVGFLAISGLLGFGTARSLLDADDADHTVAYADQRETQDVVIIRNTGSGLYVMTLPDRALVLIPWDRVKSVGVIAKPERTAPPDIDAD